MVKTIFTDEQGLEIYKRLKNGERKLFLAEEYKCSITALCNIERCALRWKRIAPLVKML